jgi:hypothetical protein
MGNEVYYVNFVTDQFIVSVDSVCNVMGSCYFGSNGFALLNLCKRFRYAT